MTADIDRARAFAAKTAYPKGARSLMRKVLARIDELEAERDHEAEGHQLSVDAWNRDVLPLRAHVERLRAVGRVARRAQDMMRWALKGSGWGNALARALDDLHEGDL